MICWSRAEKTSEPKVLVMGACCISYEAAAYCPLHFAKYIYKTAHQISLGIPTEDVPVPPVDAPVYISVAPRASPKCRFLADIHSNTVSLLVRAPHVQRSLSKLNVNFGGKKILETDSTYYSTQLSENVYLINLEGPEEGARLEVALDGFVSIMLLSTQGLPIDNCSSNNSILL